MYTVIKNQGRNPVVMLGDEFVAEFARLDVAEWFTKHLNMTMPKNHFTSSEGE